MFLILVVAQRMYSSFSKIPPAIGSRAGSTDTSSQLHDRFSGLLEVWEQTLRRLRMRNGRLDRRGQILAARELSSDRLDDMLDLGVRLDCPLLGDSGLCLG